MVETIGWICDRLIAVNMSFHSAMTDFVTTYKNNNKEKHVAIASLYKHVAVASLYKHVAVASLDKHVYC